MSSSMPRVGRADVVVGVVAAALFCLVAVAVVTGWPPLAEIDRAGAAWGERNGGAQSWWVPVWTTVSAVFGPLAFRIAAVVALVWMLVRRRRGASRAEASTLFFASATVLLGGIVPVAVKAVVDRPRPEAALVDALHSSFPSAHAFGITTAALVVMVALVGRVSVAAWRATGGVAGALVVLMCVARVALAAHYVSDVTAGVCLAVVWVLVARLLWQRLSASSAAPARSR
ncbi:phosphatase PAP2 family protein [Microbacterium lacticum]